MIQQRVIGWDGANVPTGMKELPTATYVLEPVYEESTPKKDAGLRLARDQMETGDVRPLDEVIDEIRRRHAR